MKPWLRFFLTAGVLLAATAGLRAQILSPTGLSATPGIASPGTQVSFNMSVANSDSTAFSGTADFTITLTHTVTGASFTFTVLGVTPDGGGVPAAAVDPGSGHVQFGTGSFTVSHKLPTQTLQAGSYTGSVVMSNPSAGSVVNGTFAVNSGILLVNGKPDLQITGLTYPSGTSYTGGTKIPMTVTYCNNQITNGNQNVPYTPGINGLAQRVRIKIVLSTNATFGDADDFQLTYFDIDGPTTMGSNPTVDNAGNTAIEADGSPHTFTWNQVLPGNFTGSYYVMAKIDAFDALPQNDPPTHTVDGNNIWGGSALNPGGTLINLIPSNFPTTYLASHISGGTFSATGYSDNPSMSTDGRYVAFASDATDLVTGDTNSARDIFLFDSQTNLVRRLSLSQQGAQGNGASNNPAVSGNGRYVAFESLANNFDLHNGDTNGFSDIFVVDVLTGLITRVSGLNATAGQGNGSSFKPAISSTGRYIVFQSNATNLVPGLTVAPGVSHVYLYDRNVNGISSVFDTAGNTATYLVDVAASAPSTGVGNDDAIQPTISADGSWIAFASKASNLTAGGTTSGRQHVYVRALSDVVGMTTSGIKLVSVATTTAAEGNGHSQTPSLSADGHFVAFASLASNLVNAGSPGGADANGVSDIFVYDNDAAAATPVVRRVSLTDSGTEGHDPSSPANQKLGSINPTISADGRYVAFASLDSDLTSGDLNGQAQTTDSNGAVDIFVHDRDANNTDPNGVGNPGNYDTVATNTTLVSVNPFGYQTGSLLGTPSTAASNIYPVISANGRFVAFPSDAENTGGLAFGATNQLPEDTNNARDIFLFDRRTNTTITSPTPPSVTITSPGSTNNLLVNTSIPITATATTNTGVVSSVQFFVNGTSVGTSTVFPYTQTWMPTAVGVYTLSALVTDSFGNIGVSANVFINVVAAPSVGVTGPAAGSTFTLGNTQTLKAVAAASNPGASIVSVKFYANGVAIGSGNAVYVPADGAYELAWTPTFAGTYAVTAVAVDSIGTQATAPAISVIVSPTSGGGGVGGGTPP